MPGIDWKSPDSYSRLLAAMVASMSDSQMKLNYKRIADFYGDGATYDSIEGRFRIVKKQAMKLKEEVENGRPIAPPRGNNRSAESTPRKPKTPRANQNSQDGVLNGRISKSNPSTPTKRRPNAQIKRELMEQSMNSSASASGSSACTDVETPSSNDNADFLLDESSFVNYQSFDTASFDMIAGPPSHMSQQNMMGGVQNDLWDYEQGV